MTEERIIRYPPGKTTPAHILSFLKAIHADYHKDEPYDCDPIPYSEKLSHFAECIFIERQGGDLDILGGVIGYCNDLKSKIAYISFIGRTKSAGAGMGSSLMDQFIALARERQMNRIRLEVNKINAPARRFYSKFGFHEVEDRGLKFLMEKWL